MATRYNSFGLPASLAEEWELYEEHFRDRIEVACHADSETYEELRFAFYMETWIMLTKAVDGNREYLKSVAREIELYLESITKNPDHFCEHCQQKTGTKKRLVDMLFGSQEDNING